MTFTRRRMLLAAPILAIAAANAAAQDTAKPIPNLGNFSLTPSGPQPTPSATPIPVPILSLPAIAPTPVPSATPTPRRSVLPKPTSTPTETPAPAETPIPQRATPGPEATPTPASTPMALPSPTATVTSPATIPVERAPLWPWLAGAALLAIGGGWTWMRRRRPDPADEPVVMSEPVFVAETPAMPRAWLTLALRPTRAGLNMLSATVDCEVTIANRGDAPATDIRLKTQLLSASGGQDSAIAVFADEPIGRPAAPAFALAPGEERRLRTVAALPREAIAPMTASGRPMFIPLVALNTLYAAGEGVSGQTVQAFAVGVERVDSAKLAPFWLDGPPRMQDAVAARAHAVAVER